MDAMTITMPQLENAMRRWAEDSRAGKTRTLDETHALPIEQQANESARTLWDLLASPTTSTNMTL